MASLETAQAAVALLRSVSGIDLAAAKLTDGGIRKLQSNLAVPATRAVRLAALGIAASEPEEIAKHARGSLNAVRVAALFLPLCGDAGLASRILAVRIPDDAPSLMDWGAAAKGRLSREEEYLLARAYRTLLDGPPGSAVREAVGLACRNAVVLSHSKLAACVGARWRKRKIGFDDAAAESRMWLLESAKEFDPEQDAKFLTFCYRALGWRVRSAATACEFAATIPRANGPLHEALAAKRMGLAAPEPKRPTGGYVSRHLAAAAVHGRDWSFDEPLGGDSETTLADIIGSLDPAMIALEDEDELRVMRMAMLRALDILEADRGVGGDRLMLRMSLQIPLTPGGPKTQSGIGRVLGVSQQRVSQLHEEAVPKVAAIIKRLKQDGEFRLGGDEPLASSVPDLDAEDCGIGEAEIPAPEPVLRTRFRNLSAKPPPTPKAAMAEERSDGLALKIERMLGNPAAGMARGARNAGTKRAQAKAAAGERRIARAEAKQDGLAALEAARLLAAAERRAALLAKPVRKEAEETIEVRAARAAREAAAMEAAAEAAREENRRLAAEWEAGAVARAARVFAAHRWAASDGVPECPACSCRAACSMRRGGSAKWRCKGCGKDFTLTSGTLFASQKMPLPKCLEAVSLFADGGHSAHGISKILGVNYKPVFAFIHKLREAMAKEDAGDGLPIHLPNSRHAEGYKAEAAFRAQGGGFGRVMRLAMAAGPSGKFGGYTSGQRRRGRTGPRARSAVG